MMTGQYQKSGDERKIKKSTSDEQENFSKTSTAAEISTKE